MFRYRCGQCGAEISATTDKAGFACPHCGIAVSNTDPGTALPAGYILGGFEIVRKIGCGSSGNVYQATQLSMGRSVAVKVLFSDLTQDRAVISQFFEEVKILGQIQNPNIVCALEAGYDHGLYFLAMQYIAGTTLEEYLEASGAMKVETALSIAGVIAEALQTVWNKYHFCHRDIKPGNIMIDEDDKPMLLDFGTALRHGENSIRNGMIEGSPSYMSPEQAGGKPLTFSSDMYSLGVTLYHMLTGAVPYSDPDVNKVLQMHCTAPFPPPSERGITLPPPVTALLRKMMAKTPKERYGSWEAFLAELARIRKNLKKKQGGAHPSGGSAGNPPPQPAKKGFSVIAFMGNIVSLLVVIGTVWVVMSRNNNTSALNQLESAKKAYNNVINHGSDPERALSLFRKAKSFSRKFGVKSMTIQEVDAACERCVGELEALITESKRSEELHLLTLYVVRNADSALADAARHQGEENVSPVKLKESAAAVISGIDALEKVKFRGQLCRDRAEQDLGLLRTVQMELEKMLGPEQFARLREEAGAAAKADGQNEQRRSAAGPEKALAANGKVLTREGLASMEQAMIDAVRRKDFKAAEEALAIPFHLQKDDSAAGADRKEMEQTVIRLRTILDKALPVLRKFAGGKNRREQIRENARSDPDGQYCAFLVSGDFGEASALMPGKDAGLFDELVQAYLRPRIILALENAEQGRLEELEELRSEYKNFEPYRKLEKEISSRNSEKGMNRE